MPNAALPYAKSIAVLSCTALLAGCNPCNYEFDTTSPTRQRVEVIPPSPADLEKSKQAYDQAYRDGTPEYRAQVDAARQKYRDQQRHAAEAAAPKKASGYDPAKDPFVHSRAPTLSECAVDRGTQAFVWVLFPLLGFSAANWLSRRFTGRGLIAWIKGNRP